MKNPVHASPDKGTLAAQNTLHNESGVSYAVWFRASNFDPIVSSDRCELTWQIEAVFLYEYMRKNHICFCLKKFEQAPRPTGVVVV